MKRMTDTRPQVVRSYLAQLDAALVGVPESLRSAIRDGVEEELAGLDAAAASELIEELGDPEFIAAEAREGTVGDQGTDRPAHTAQTDGSLSRSRGFAVTSVLLFGFAGVVIPVVGWFVGLAMVWLSSAWMRWEKWLASAITPVLVLIGAGVATLLPSSPEVSLLLPTMYDLIWSVILMGIPVNIVVGAWLLWRTRGRFDPAR